MHDELLRRAFILSLALCAGCAELAAMTPRVSLEARATERTTGSATRADRLWSYGVVLRVEAALESREVPPDDERAPTAPQAAASPVPCRLPQVCLWEARSRGAVLARLLPGALEADDDASRARAWP